MQGLKLYPYMNLVASGLKGERWKHVPGFEGSYQVSNIGRVRSLDRVVPHTRL